MLFGIEFVNIDQNQYEIVTTKRVEMNKGNTIFIVAIRKKCDINTEVEGEKKTSNTTLKEEEDPKVVEASSSETSPSFCRTKHKSTNPKKSNKLKNPKNIGIRTPDKPEFREITCRGGTSQNDENVKIINLPLPTRQIFLTCRPACGSEE